jgi:hypothetical protein
MPKSGPLWKVAVTPVFFKTFRLILAKFSGRFVSIIDIIDASYDIGRRSRRPLHGRF